MLRSRCSPPISTTSWDSQTTHQILDSRTGLLVIGDDNSTGWQYWNLIALYLYLLHTYVFPLPGWLSVGLVVGFALLTFVPSRYLYPIHKGRLNMLTSIAEFITRNRLPACPRSNPICLEMTGSTAPSRDITMPKTKIPA